MVLTQHTTFVSKKAIISGNILEVFEYEYPYMQGYQGQNKRGRASKDATQENKRNNRTKVLQRARTDIRRLANANPQLDKFFTLTFKDNITDIKFANNEFSKFIKRVKRHYKDLEFQYIAVIEFQKRGAIHYHVLCNLPYTPKAQLQQIWRNGFVKINQINNVDNVGAYITKYMTKDNDDSRLHGYRSYFTSQGLKQPIIIINDIQIDNIVNDNIAIKEPYSTVYSNEYLGNIKYTQYHFSTNI
ncbi:MAG: Rep protein [Firmicutes bacterium]|nr:Rep protein [Bacillota bacterium]MCM1393910.1 hypothetical protein [[Eubacterium] siraeum]